MFNLKEKSYKANKKILRLKRNMPDSVVSVVDSFNFSLLKSKYEYSNSTNIASNPNFFIIGSGRSGNTLLKKLLSENYNIFIPPEIPGLGNTIRQFTRSRGKSWEHVVVDTLSTFKKNSDIDKEQKHSGVIYNLNDELGIDYNKLQLKLVQLPSNEHTANRIISEIYTSIAETSAHNNCLIGDKTPWNVFHLPRIQKTFPKAKYIHMLRDPRSVVSSYLYNFGGNHNVTLIDAIYRWKDSIRKCNSLETNLGKKQVFQLKYESLVNNHKQSIDDIATFLVASKRKHGPVKIVDIDESLEHHKKLSQPIDKKSIDSWKELLSHKEIKRIESLCKKEMTQLGYTNFKRT